jgi:hypothetical protein
MQNQIKVTDKLEIQSLTVTDPTVILAAKGLEAEGKNLADYFTQVITVGVKVLQVAGVSVGVEMLADEIERTKKGLSEHSQKFKDDIKKSISEAVGPEGDLTKSINDLIEGFGDDLGNMAGDENSPIRQGIQKQLDAIAKKLADDFTRASNLQKDEIAKMLDLSNPQSPLKRVGEDLKSIGEVMGQVRERLTQEEVIGELMDLTPQGGNDYESDAISAVQVIAGWAGDDCLAVGHLTGLIPRNKKGDGVVDLKVGANVFARIVVECKDSDLTKADWETESAGGRANRGATGFIGLCKRIEDMPNKSRMMVLDSQGIVLAYNPTVDDPQILHLIYQVVKFNTLRATGNLDEMDMADINRHLEEALAALGKFDSINKSISAIENSAKSIRTDAKTIKDAMTESISAVRTSIARGIEPPALEAATSLELEAGENEGPDA